MYRNVFGEKVSRAKHKEMENAAKNRRELIAGGVYTRRDLMKLGLITGAGLLIPKSGLSARLGAPLPVMQAASPPIKPFVDPMPIMPIKQAVGSLSPTPTACPNTAINPANGLPFEGRTLCHQAFSQFTPKKLYQISQQAATTSMSSSLPPQLLWTFDGISPGPTYVAHYNEPVLVRNVCNLPANNGGFGHATVTTHLHNGHTPSESDGFFFDWFPRDANGNEAIGVPGQFYDQHYPNVLAGFASTNPPNGDINESLSTLWYHDHRVDFTSQNTYKGLMGFYCLFNQFDTGNEETGFRLPSFPQFDIPLAFADKVYDPNSHQLVFDLFNLDGILGDKFLVNGTIQPFFTVSPRRYRFRMLDTGPSRFYEFFLTGNVGGTGNPTTNPFFLIGTDGNLIPHPIQVQSVRIGPAERVDVIIDFTNFAGQTLYLENRLNQLNGQGPTAVDSQLFPQNSGNTECVNLGVTANGAILPAGAGNLVMQFNVTGPKVKDNSVDPATKPTYYQLPSTNVDPRIVRTFKFDRLNGQWSINGQFMDCGYGSGGTGGESTEMFRFTVQQNSVEQWLLTNLTGDWTHPVHIHLEEHQILSRNRGGVTVPTDQGRKDVTQLHPNERAQLFFRFRDWLGKYPIHCHNVVHEDHAMMALWHVAPTGDNINVP